MILLAGLNYSILQTKVTNYLFVFLKYYWYDFLWIESWFIKLSAFSLFIESMLCLEGIPVNYKIFYNWFRVESPGKIGSPIKSSAKMQPTLHTSVDFP